MAIFLGQFESWSCPEGGPSRALRKMWRLCFLCTHWARRAAPRTLFSKKIWQKKTKKIAKFYQKWPYLWDNLSCGAALRAAAPGPFAKCRGCVSFAPIGRPISSPPHGGPWMGTRRGARRSLFCKKILQRNLQNFAKKGPISGRI